MFRDVIKTLCGETMCCRPPAGGCGFDSCWTYKNIKCGCFSYCLYIHVVTILCSLTVVMFLHLVERKYKGEAGTEQCLLFTDYYWPCEFCTTRTGPDCDVMDGARAVISCLVQLGSEAFPASIILPSIVLQAFRLLAACLYESIYSRYIYIYIHQHCIYIVCDCLSVRQC